MSAGVTVRAVEPTPTAVVAARPASQADFQEMWGPMLNEVWAFLRGAAPEGLYRDGHNIMLYKDDVPSVEVGVQVSGSFAPAGQVVASALPGGLVAAATHTVADRRDRRHSSGGARVEQGAWVPAGRPALGGLRRS